VKLINRDTDYALRALIHIAKNSQRISVTEIASKLDIPKPFLRKILQILNKEGILISYKGKGGGFLLAIPPKKILLGDLINIFQGPVKLADCVIKKKICSDIKTCPLRKRIRALEKHVVSELKSTTLDDLVQDDRSFSS
jgi:Rrf2 family protein